MISLGPVAGFITWDPDPVLTTLGSFPVRWYSLLFATGTVASYLLLDWLTQTETPPEDRPAASREVAWWMIGIVAGALVGARAAHILFYADPMDYLSHPARILRLWEGGLASHGGGVGVMLVTWLWARRRGVPFLLILDRVVFTSAVMAMAVRLGNLFNSEIVGRPTDVPWAFVFLRHHNAHAITAAADFPHDLSSQALSYLPAHIPRHPSQLYEAALGLGILLVLLALRARYRRAGAARPLGLFTGLTFVLYFGGRIVLEGFKEFTALADGAGWGLTMGQWLSAPFMLLGFFVLWASLTGRLGATAPLGGEGPAARGPGFVGSSRG